MNDVIGNANNNFGDPWTPCISMCSRASAGEQGGHLPPLDLEFFRTYIRELKVYVNFTSYIYIYIYNICVCVYIYMYIYKRCKVNIYFELYVYIYILSCPSLEKCLRTPLSVPGQCLKTSDCY